jgi:hypothetical protein
MATETVVKNEFATILYYPEKGIVHHEWHKACFGKGFQEIMLAATNHLKKNKGTKWLSDDRNFTVLSPEDTKWGQEVWFPETKKAGWKYWAILLPVKQVGQMNIKRLIAEYKAAGVTAQIFENPEEAMKWLESQ